MNLLEEKVEHSQFGSGTVIRQSDTRVEVQFGKAYGIKKFVYPSAFISFLTLSDPAAKENLFSEIQALIETDKRRQADIDRQRDEALRSLLEERSATKKPARPRSSRAKKTAAH